MCDFNKSMSMSILGMAKMSKSRIFHEIAFFTNEKLHFWQQNYLEYMISYISGIESARS